MAGGGAGGNDGIAGEAGTTLQGGDGASTSDGFWAGYGGGGGWFGGGGGSAETAGGASGSGGSGGGGSSGVDPARTVGVVAARGVWPYPGWGQITYLEDGPVPVRVAVTPAQAKSPGQAVTVTATLSDQDGNSSTMGYRVVTFDRRGVNPGTTTATTDVNGNATVTYTGVGGGVDIVTASTPSLAGVTVSGVGTVAWAGAPSGTVVAFKPPGAHAPTGTTTLAFEARNADGSPFSGKLRWAVGPLGNPGAYSNQTDVTGGSGSIPVTTAASEVEIAAYADRTSGGTFNAQDPQEGTGYAAVTTRPVPRGTTVTFTPPVAQTAVGTDATLTVKATWSDGLPYAGPVRWCATRLEPTATTCVASGIATATAGAASIAVRPTATDSSLRVSAYADGLGAGTPDPTETAGAAVVAGTSAPTVTTTTSTLPTVTTTTSTLPTVTTTTSTLPTVTTTLPPAPPTTLPPNAPPSAATLVDPPHAKAFADGEPQVFAVNATDPNGDAYTATVTATNTSTGAVRTFATAASPSGTVSRGTPAPPLAAGSYTWTARATDARGATSPTASTTRSFTVAPGAPTPPPGAPNVIAPADGKTFLPGEPQGFVVSAASAAVASYSGVVTIRNAATGAVAATVSTSTTLWGLPSSGAAMPPLPAGSYTFTARVTPMGGTDSPSSLPRSFSVASTVPNAAPGAPSLLSPAASSAFSTTDPQLFVVNAVDADGDAYTGTASITNQYGTTTSVTTAAAPSGTDSEGAPAVPLAQGSYTWRARATDVRGATGPWSDSRPFTVANQAPITPTLVSPAPAWAFSTDDAQVFTLASSDAEGDPYNATVTIRTTAGAVVTSFPSAPALSGDPSSATPAPPLPPGDYTWAARATDAKGAAGPESAPRAFSVILNRPPGIPDLVAPTPGKTYFQEDPQAFTISAVDPNRDTYTGTITVRTLSGSVAATITTTPAPSGGYSSGAPALPLAGGTYTWSATATDERGSSGPPSVTRRFTVSSASNVPPVALPSDTPTTRASQDSLRAESGDGSERPDISGDGRWVAFESEADDLVNGDTNGRRDIFVHDRLTGGTERVSVSDGEAEASAPGWFESFDASISDNGRYVAFISSATNLVPFDTNGFQDVFVRDREAGTTVRVSLNTGGTQANGAAYEADLSGDGGHVAFSSDAANLVANDTNSAIDVFVRDIGVAQTVRVSTKFGSKAQSSGGILSARNPSIGHFGGQIAFESDASDLTGGSNDTNFATDVFFHDRGTSWGTWLVSADASLTSANGYSNNAKVSGSLVLFDSTASNHDGVTDDTNGQRDVFVYDDDTGVAQRLSVNSAQAQANGPSFDAAFTGGRHVAFRSAATNMVAGDRNGVDDVFLRDRDTLATTLVSHDADGHQANNTSGAPSLSSDGMHIAFESQASNLVGADTNRTADVFAYNRKLSLTCVAGALSAVGCLSGYGFKASSDRLGLEDFYGYHAFDVGSDTAYLNVSNGNLVVQGTDLAVAGQGLNMRLTHTYNSQKDQGDGPLGRGWRIGVADGESEDLLGAVVSAVLSADVGQILEVVVTEDQFDFFDADGTRHHFVKGGTEGPGWHAPPGIDLTLTDYLVGTERRYKATRPDGVFYEFRPAGGGGYFVDRVADRNGNQLTFSYSGGRLSSITDAGGRSITFAWSGDYLSSAAYGGQTVSYNVDASTGRLNSISVGGRTTGYSYGADGLASVTDARNHTTSFTVVGGMLTRVTDRAGKHWNVAYNSTSCQPGDAEAAVATCVTDPEGRSEVYTSSAAGNLVSHRDAGDTAPNQRSWLWEDNRLLSATDEEGNTAEYVYNANGQVVLTRESGSGDPPLTTSLVYRDVAPGVADLVEARVGVDSGDVRTWRFARSETGDLTATTAPDETVTRFGYLPGGRLASVTDANGRTTSYGAHHPSGRPGTVTDPLGKTRTTSYDAFGRVTSVLDRNGQTWSLVYDARGNATSRSTPVGTATYAYDANDNLTSSTPPGGATVTRAYDPRDLLVESSATVDGVLRKSTYAYDDDGELRHLNEPRSFAGSPVVTQRVEYRRFPNNRISSMVDEAGLVTDLTYTPGGRLRTAVEPAGTAGRHVTTWTYNRRGQATSVLESGHSAPSSSVYNLHGELTSAKTPAGSATTYVHDRMGRLLRVVDALGRQSVRTYDPVGNLVSLTQPEGQGGQATTAYTYTPRNEIASESDPADGSHVVEYSYDDEGRQRFRHDKHNGVVERTVEQTFRADGALASRTATGPGLPTHQSSFVYDTVGNPTSATATLNGATVSSLSLAYNGAFEPTGWTEAVYNTSGVAVTKSGSYAYQPDGLLASRTVDGLATSYAHTLNGRESRVTPWGGLGSFAHEHYDNGLLRKTTMPNGAVVDQLFDSANRLVSRIVRKQDIAMTQLSAWTGIVHDDDDQRTAEAVTQAQVPGTTTEPVKAGNAEYAYDALGRLVSAKHPFEPDPVSYSLDDGGNILRDADTAYTYSKNRLVRRAGTVVEDHPSGGTTTTATVAAYDYDRLGNQSRETATATSTSTLPEGESETTTANVVRSYSYDAASHPRRVAADDGSWVDYSYDALGRLARRVEHPASGTDVVTLFFHDGTADTLVLETNGAGTVEARYVLDSRGEPLAQDRGGSRSYYIEDPRGNLAQQLDGAMNVVAVYGYDPYGEEKEALTRRAPSANWESRLRFQMAPRDPATGAYNLGGRLLDPGIGRFVGADSYVGAAANMGLALDPLTGNRYLYAGANPAGLIDDGHAPKWLENAWKAGKRALKNAAVRMVVAGAVCVLLSAGIGCLVVAGAVLATASYAVNSKTRTIGGAVKAAVGGVGEGLFSGFSAKVTAAAARIAASTALKAAQVARQGLVARRAAGAAQTALRGGAGPVRVGQRGLDALGVTQNTSRIALGGGRYRVPDILDEAGGVIGEVKNVQSLSYTAQLRDYVGYAQTNQLQFDLYVRGSTRLSGPLQQAVDNGSINLWRWLSV